MSLNFEQALQILDQLTLSSRELGLSKAEKAVLRAAWQGLTYEDIAPEVSLTGDYLSRGVAPKLWNFLSDALGLKVKKNTLRNVLIRQVNLEARKSQSAGLIPILGGQPPDISQFVGYADELTNLQRLVVEKRCVVLNGPGGIGKSFLAAKLMVELFANGSGYDYLIWKSIQCGPHFSELIDDLLQLLLNQLSQEDQLPEQTPAKISLLIDLLQSHRCLVVLDGAEAILQRGNLLARNPYGEYWEYGLFISRIVEEQHQSCLLLTSREPFSDIIRYQNFQRPAAILKLRGVGEAAKQILAAEGLSEEEEWGNLINLCGENPYRLKVASSYIKDFFAGNVGQYVEEKSAMLLEEMLEQQLTHLSELEQELIVYLATQIDEEGVESITFHRIRTEFRSANPSKGSLTDIMRYLKLLSDRSLVEFALDRDGARWYSLQPDVKKFVLTRLAVYNQQLPKAN